ncbi:MAG TPA: AAA family ATPase [Solirubrobacterales bacterium]|nr:AAA family ATPase [Solirubrobacterales bacterium]
MGFLSRKKPKPAPVEIQEEQPIGDELQRMEELVPERPEIEGDDSSSLPVASAEPSPKLPAEGAFLRDGDSSTREEEDHTSVAEAVTPAPVVEEAPETPLNADAPELSEDEEEGEARMKAVDLIAPTRLDFLNQKAETEEEPVKTAEVIAFANQKGGVAKTTTTLNLAVAFAESGYRVLCIDLDPQGNLTMSQGIDPDKVEKSLYDVLVNDMPISEIIVKREIDIAVASIDLAGAEIAMSTKIGRERSLEKALKEVHGDYDFVCIDTPPSLGLLTINALTAANKVIVPVQCEYLSMRGLVQLQNTLRMIQENLNPDVRIEGILPTMLDSRTIHAKEAVEILEENFGDLVFRSRIKKAIKFAEAPVKGASVLKYDSDSSAANYYRELAKEVLANGSA